MLLVTLFTDVFYFYINLYKVTGSFNESQVNKFKYFDRQSLVHFEKNVDEVILEIKNKLKIALSQGIDKSLYLNLQGGYQITLKEFNLKLTKYFDLFLEIRNLLLDNEQQKFIMDEITGKQYISAAYITKI